MGLKNVRTPTAYCRRPDQGYAYKGRSTASQGFLIPNSLHKIAPLFIHPQAEAWHTETSGRRGKRMAIRFVR